MPSLCVLVKIGVIKENRVNIGVIIESCSFCQAAL